MKNYGKVLLLISITLLCINYVLYHSISGYQLKSIVRFISFFFLILSIIIKNIKTIPRYMIFVFFLSILSIVFYSEALLNLSYLVLITYSLSINVEKKNVKKYLFIISIITIILYLSLLKLGVIHDSVTNYNFRIRHTLGFDNPNAFSIIVASLFYLFFMNIKKYRILLSLIIIAINFYISFLLGSRTLLYSTIIFLILHFFSYNSNKFKKINLLLTSKFFIRIFVFMLFISPFIICFMVSHNIIMDSFISGRSYLLFQYFEYHSLLNYLIGFSNVATVDNSYAIILCATGVLGFMYSYKIIVNSIISDKSNFPLIISLLFFGTMESILIRPESLISIYFWYIIFDNNYYRKKKVLKDEK